MLCCHYGSHIGDKSKPTPSAVKETHEDSICTVLASFLVMSLATLAVLTNKQPDKQTCSRTASTLGHMYV
jgi:hypothetical protein